MNTAALDNNVVFWDLECSEESFLQLSILLFLNIIRRPQVKVAGTVLPSSPAAVSAIKGGEHKGQKGRKRRFFASRTSNLKPSSIFLGLQICISLSNGSIIFILNYINLCLSLEHTRRQKMSRELQFKNYFISLGIRIFYWNKKPHIFNHSHTDLVRYTFNYSPLSAYFIGDWILLPAEAVRVRKKLPNQYPPSDSLLIFVLD